MKKGMLTTYETAVKWCHNNLVLFNEINEIDENFFEDNPEVFKEGEGGEYPEYYQYFITDMGEFDAKWLSRVFDLNIGYSEKLNKYILCVPHYGTSWDYVPCEVKDKEWWELHGEKLSYNALTGY